MKSPYKSKCISENKFWRVVKGSIHNPHIVSTVSGGVLTTSVIMFKGEFTYSQTSVWDDPQDYCTLPDKKYWKRTSRELKWKYQGSRNT